MHQLLSRGLSIQLPNLQKTCTITDFLGGGGEGEVYRARVDAEDIAIKWYFEHRRTPAQRKVLQRLIDQGSPSRTFLWPISLAEPGASGVAGFGYAMPLRPQRFHDMRDLMRNKIDPTFRALATTGFELSRAFRLLHARGCAYCDINFGNAFFDPLTGEALVCDNDNATYADEQAGVVGTPDFMAPEIVRGEKPPDTDTDLFSLSVLLFYLFHIHHPLAGCRMRDIHCWDLPARTRLFGQKPVFIFHPSDRSNRALDWKEDPTGDSGANAIAYWPIYPEFLRRLFTDAFVTGLDPARRVRESQWQRAMIHLRDAVFPCPNTKCGAENFFEPSTATRRSQCWKCQAALQPPFRLELRDGLVMLNHDTRLFPHHLVAGAEYDFSAPLAEVARHPQNAALWGLRNLGSTSWCATRADKSTFETMPGKAMPLSPGLDVQFGSVHGRVMFG